MKSKTIKKTLLYGLILGLVILGGGLGARAYKSARQARLIKQARTYLAKADEKKAALCLQRALRYNPKDVKASRLMAELSERARSPGALIWRSRVVELNPHALDDRLALAQTAMMFRDYRSATNALEGVDAAGKKTAAYHNIAGAVAAAGNQSVQAEAHFLEASRLEPTNAVPRLNLAVVRLQQTNAQAVAEARATLQQLSAKPDFRCQALRELIADAMRYARTDDALALSADLLNQTNSAFSDRLLRLEVLRVSKSPAFGQTLAAFQKDAASDPAKIQQLATWQLLKTGPADPLAWLETLPPNLRTNPPAALLSAECRTQLKDWRGLQSTLEHQDWTELDFVRHAFLARATRGLELASSSKTEWELATKAANNRKQSLLMLLQMAGQWHWQSEGEQILWTILNRFPEEKWVVPALSKTLYDEGRTRSLMAFYGQLAKANPTDLSSKNNLVMTALLLDAQELKPHDLARELYQKGATNSSYASTYAFSLHLLKKDAEALKVMQQLPPKALEDPSIAGYYGLILNATGNPDKARVYLEWASRAKLLPEEKKLFDRAKAGA
jgi:Flp pilus assembly protein TadD/Holliday junction resolvase-like predicted endonuclease